ncbi:DUF418 domain-containing protein [Sphingomonas sp. ZT3P38]|uniref:DUF418 domain-containing protein n=1 Tax=Parasphingomonas zepuensis TaxID=3096161 RepID=UPI002FC68BC9
MSDVTMARAEEPDGAPRIAVLDILRGVAILGILFMNINDMGASFRAGGDVRHFGWAPIDQVAWWLREVFANGTARCLLEMLFGAGMVILTGRVADAVGKRDVMRRYYRRNIVLVAFGLVHMFILLWGGDILHTYGLAALVVFWFRQLRPRDMIALGLVMALAQLVGGGYSGYYQGVRQQAVVATLQAKSDAGQGLNPGEKATLGDAAKDKAERAKDRAEQKAEVAREDRDRSGTTATWVTEQVRMSAERLFGAGELFAIWESASVMLIGAGLFKLGILQGQRSRSFYWRMTILAYLVGGTLRVIGAGEIMRFDDAPQTNWATQEIARQAMTLGHVGLINLLVSSAVGARLMRPFVAAGRTALSIYVLQTLICLWILYPPFALGLYGTQGWAEMMAVSVVIDLGLLWLANVYVRHFRIAPVEWAWRSIVEERRLPFRSLGR